MKMLVVEDDAETREITCRLLALEFPFLTILQAEEGKRGLELFKEHLPDIVITDIKMPEMDGIAMAMGIKALRQDTKIIVITAHSDKDRLSHSMLLGINDYIQKPVDFKALITAVEACIEEISHEIKEGYR